MKDQLTTPHPYAEIFPLVEGQPLWDMGKNIKEFGQLDKIMLYEDKVLDGRRREMACVREGVKPKYETFKGTDAEALEYVMSKNMHRRHLGEGDRVLAAARYAKAKGGGDRDEKKPSNFRPSQNATVENEPTNADAADRFNVSKAKVDRAKVVLASGTPELQQAVSEDEVSISDAAKVAKEPPAVQRKAVADVKAGKSRTATGAVKARKKKDQPASTNGKPYYDDTVLEKLITPIGRELYKRADALGYNDKSNKEHKDCLEIASKLFACWRRLQAKK